MDTSPAIERLESRCLLSASQSSYSFTVSEDASSVGLIDLGQPNAAYSVWISAGDDAGQFSVEPTQDSNGFIIKVSDWNPLDYETQQSYILLVEHADWDGNSTISTVSISVTDVDEAPRFNANYSFTVPEFANSVGTISASDPQNDYVYFWIESGDPNGKFYLESTGPAEAELKVNEWSPLDYEAGDVSFALTVVADDMHGNSASTLVNVNVVDIPESPEFENPVYVFTTPENSAFVGSLSATDPQGDPIYFWISSGNEDGHFQLSSPIAGTVDVQVCESNPINYENGDTQFSLTINADDGYGNTGTALVHVNVTDVAEALVFNQSVYQFSIGVNHDEVGDVLAIDPQSDPVYYWIESGDDNGYFSVDSDGKLTVAQPMFADAAIEIHSLQVRASDPSGNQATSTVNVYPVRVDIAGDSNSDSVVDANDEQVEEFELIPIAVNDDDDNENGVLDFADPVAVADEDDLVEVIVAIHSPNGTDLSGYDVSIEGGDSNRAWRTPDRQSPIMLDGSERISVSDLPISVFLEGYSEGIATVHVYLVQNGVQEATDFLGVQNNQSHDECSCTCQETDEAANQLGAEKADENSDTAISSPYALAHTSNAAYLGADGEPADAETITAALPQKLRDAGWKSTGPISDKNSGFHAVVFNNTKTADTVLAFAGTQMLSSADWLTNFANAFSLKTQQYESAMQFAEKVKKIVADNCLDPSEKLRFTGHSLGGGLASAAALSTGLKAVTFNAAGIHNNAKDLGGNVLDKSKHKQLITAHRVSGKLTQGFLDPLSLLQEGTMPPGFIGNVIPPILQLYTGNTGNTTKIFLTPQQFFIELKGNAHGMDAVMMAGGWGS